MVSIPRTRPASPVPEEGIVKSIAQMCVAYYRTSSAANVGKGKDSLPRQQEAVRKYAKAHKLTVVREFYDAGVSGSAPVDSRPGFSELLTYVGSNGARVVLTENAGRFARDLAVQIAGHDLLKSLGYELIPVDAPDFFTDETPTATMVRQILGSVAQFEKAMIVQKLKRGRDKKIAETGRCGGAARVPGEVVKQARRLARKNPSTGRRRSLRAIASELAELGFLGPSGGPYYAQSIKRMVGR